MAICICHYLTTVTQNHDLRQLKIPKYKEDYKFIKQGSLWGTSHKENTYLAQTPLPQKLQAVATENEMQHQVKGK